MQSNFNLVQLNLWIGLAKGVVGLPADLHGLGYRDRAIERTFQNSAMESVCPELVLASRELQHAMLLEFKSGSNTDRAQLSRYSHVESTDLQRSFLDPVESVQHDIVIVGRAEHGARLRIGIQEGDFGFPLLLKDNEGLYLDLHAFSVPALDASFSPRMAIDWDQVPMSFVPFDQESSDADVAESVIPAILECMHSLDSRIEVEPLCASLTRLWSIIGPTGKDQIRAKVKAVLAKAARRQFSAYLTQDRGGFTISNNPLELQSDRRAGVFRGLRKLAEEFIEELRRADSQPELDFGGRR